MFVAGVSVLILSTDRPTDRPVQAAASNSNLRWLQVPRFFCAPSPKGSSEGPRSPGRNAPLRSHRLADQIDFAESQFKVNSLGIRLGCEVLTLFVIDTHILGDHAWTPHLRLYKHLAGSFVRISQSNEAFRGSIAPLDRLACETSFSGRPHQSDHHLRV